MVLVKLNPIQLSQFSDVQLSRDRFCDSLEEDLVPQRPLAPNPWACHPGGTGHRDIVQEDSRVRSELKQNRCMRRTIQETCAAGTDKFDTYASRNPGKSRF